jgi:hypothetical protein
MAITGHFTQPTRYWTEKLKIQNLKQSTLSILANAKTGDIGILDLPTRAARLRCAGLHCISRISALRFARRQMACFGRELGAKKRANRNSRNVI